MARQRTVKAAQGTHCLGAGQLAGSPVGMLSADQLASVEAHLRLEVGRMKGLNDDAAVRSIRRDLRALKAEADRRHVGL